MNLPDGFPHKAPAGYSYEVRILSATLFLFGYSIPIVSLTLPILFIRYGDSMTQKKSVTLQPINHKRPGKVVDINDTRDFTAMQLNLNPLEHALYSSS